MTFMEEAWVSNSKMYLLHGSVEYWILIGLCAVKYYCIIIAGLYKVPGNSWPGFMCHSTVKMVILWSFIQYFYIIRIIADTKPFGCILR